MPERWQHLLRWRRAASRPGQPCYRARAPGSAALDARVERPGAAPRRREDCATAILVHIACINATTGPATTGRCLTGCPQSPGTPGLLANRPRQNPAAVATNHFRRRRCLHTSGWRHPKGRPATHGNISVQRRSTSTMGCRRSTIFLASSPTLFTHHQHSHHELAACGQTSAPGYSLPLDQRRPPARFAKHHAQITTPWAPPPPWR